MITRPVRSQQQHIGTEVGNRMAPEAAGWAEEQTGDDVQPGKIEVRRGHNEKVTAEWDQVQVESVQGLAGAGL
jgi:hypothetical protein